MHVIKFSIRLSIRLWHHQNFNQSASIKILVKLNKPVVKIKTWIKKSSIFRSLETIKYPKIIRLILKMLDTIKIRRRMRMILSIKTRSRRPALIYTTLKTGTRIQLCLPYPIERKQQGKFSRQWGSFAPQRQSIRQISKNSWIRELHRHRARSI